MKQIIIRDRLRDHIVDAEPVRYDWCNLELYIHQTLGLEQEDYTLTEPFTGTVLVWNVKNKADLQSLFAEKILERTAGIDEAMKKGITTKIEEHGIANDWATDPRDIDKIFDLEKLHKIMEVSK